MRHLYYSFLLGAIVFIAACGSSTTRSSTPQTAPPSAGGVGATGVQIINLAGLNIEDDGVKCGFAPILLKPAANFSADDVATLVTYFNSTNSFGSNASAPFPGALIGEKAGILDGSCDSEALSITNTRAQPVEIDNVIVTYAQASKPNKVAYRLYGCREFASQPCLPAGLGTGGIKCYVSFMLVPGPARKNLTSPCATTLQPGGNVLVNSTFSGSAQNYVVNFGLSLGDGSIVTLPASFASSHVLDFADPQQITCNHRQGSHIVQLPYNPSVGCQFPNPNK